MNIFEFFTDPVLRAPTIGSILICFLAALVGVLVFIRKRSLLGEALSHATYPGVALAVVFCGYLSLDSPLSSLILSGAFLSSLAGFVFINFLEKKLKTAPDGALTATLALFFGIGVVIASVVQNIYPFLYRSMQSYLYGQAATMRDVHIGIYALLACLIVLFILFFYHQILAISFDFPFAYTRGLGVKWIETGIILIVILTLVIGLRCVGVVLISSMLIAPATAARQFTNCLSKMFLLSGLFGAVSGFLGLYFSVFISQYREVHSTIPTGPLIVIFSGLFALYALFFAPKRGLIIRYLRVVTFRSVCVQENLLKILWRGMQKGLGFREMASQLGISRLYLYFLIFRLRRQKLVDKEFSLYKLTPAGVKKGARIVRLHRLWEVYLVNSLGLKIERVHKSAEEMEHILTPELEKKLAEWLDHPKQDPHDQPIPAQEESLNHAS